ncbi:MAG: hypothetical protein MPW13_14770 [Candidatus Manganitrophus sp.]|nr:hypothetical protein [Candidatus Manganitrophus sp.]
MPRRRRSASANRPSAYWERGEPVQLAEGQSRRRGLQKSDQRAALLGACGGTKRRADAAVKGMNRVPPTGEFGARLVGLQPARSSDPPWNVWRLELAYLPFTTSAGNCRRFALCADAPADSGCGASRPTCPSLFERHPPADFCCSAWGSTPSGRQVVMYGASIGSSELLIQIKEGGPGLTENYRPAPARAAGYPPGG